MDNDDDTPTRLPGISGWMLERCPELIPVGGIIVGLLIGTTMLIANPAGVTTKGEDYGPDAPTQPWVLFIALGGYALAAISLVMLAAALYARVTKTWRFAPDDQSTEPSGPRT